MSCKHLHVSERLANGAAIVVLCCMANMPAEAQVFDCLNTNSNRRVMTNTPKLSEFRDCRSVSLKEASVTYVPSESFGRGVATVTKKSTDARKADTPAKRQAVVEPTSEPSEPVAPSSLPAALHYDAKDKTLDFGDAGCEISGTVDSISGPACQATLRVQHRGAFSQFDVPVNLYNRESQINQGSFRRTLREGCGDTVKIEIVSCLPMNPDGY